MEKNVRMRCERIPGWDEREYQHGMEENTWMGWERIPGWDGREYQEGMRENSPLVPETPFQVFLAVSSLIVSASSRLRFRRREETSFRPLRPSQGSLQNFPYHVTNGYLHLSRGSMLLSICITLSPCFLPPPLPPDLEPALWRHPQNPLERLQKSGAYTGPPPQKKKKIGGGGDWEKNTRSPPPKKGFFLWGGEPCFFLPITSPPPKNFYFLGEDPVYAHDLTLTCAI